MPERRQATGLARVPALRSECSRPRKETACPDPWICVATRVAECGLGGRDVRPVLLTFNLGGAEIVLQAYSTFYALAWVTVITLGTVVAWRRGFIWWRALVVMVAALAVGVAGARMLDLPVNWTYYAKDMARIYDSGFRGFALYGGLIFAAATGVFLSRALHLSVWRLADSAVPALAAGIVLMRVGCFLNGCCFGKVTSLPWGVTYPPGSPAWAHQFVSGQTGLRGLTDGALPVHPTQIYEMIAAVVIGTVAVWLTLRRDGGGRRTTPDGVPFLAFALAFTVFRAGNHLLRARLITMTIPVWFYPTLYALVAAVIVGFLVWRVRAGAIRNIYAWRSPGSGG